MLVAFVICLNVHCEDTIDKMEAICIILVSIDGLIDYFCTRYNNQFSRITFKGCNAVFAIIALVLMQVHVYYWFIHDGQNYILDGQLNVSPFNEEHTNAYWFNFIQYGLRTDGEHQPFPYDVNSKLTDYPVWKNAPITPVTNGQYWCVQRNDGSSGC